MLRILLFPLLAIAALSAPPEILPQNGFRAGWTHTSFHKETHKAGDGLSAASFITWNVNPRLLIQTELEFSVRRTENQEQYLKDTITTEYTSRNLSLPFLALTPLLGNHKSQTLLFIGLSPGLNLGNSTKTFYITEVPMEPEWNIPSLDLIFGLDTRVKKGDMGLILDTRLSWGLLDQVDKMRVWTLRISAGYSFNL